MWCETFGVVRCGVKRGGDVNVVSMSRQALFECCYEHARINSSIFIFIFVVLLMCIAIWCVCALSVSKGSLVPVWLCYVISKCVVLCAMSWLIALHCIALHCALCCVLCGDVMHCMMLCVVHCVLCTVWCALCVVHCVVCTVWCALCVMHCVVCRMMLCYLLECGGMGDPRSPCFL